MKRMVDDFRDYAKIPQTVLSRINLSALIDDVLHLLLCQAMAVTSFIYT